MQKKKGEEMPEEMNHMELLSAYIIVKSFADNSVFPVEWVIDFREEMAEHKASKKLSICDAIACLADTAKAQNLSTKELVKYCETMFTHVFGESPHAAYGYMHAAATQYIQRTYKPRREPTYDELWDKYLKEDFEDAKLEVVKIEVNGNKEKTKGGTQYAITTKDNLDKKMHLIKKHELRYQFGYDRYFYEGEKTTGNIIMHRKDNNTMLEGKDLICFLIQALLHEKRESHRLEWSFTSYCRDNNSECNWHSTAHSISMPRRVTSKWKDIKHDCTNPDFFKEYKKRLRNILDECVVVELHEEPIPA